MKTIRRSLIFLLAFVMLIGTGIPSVAHALVYSVPGAYILGDHLKEYYGHADTVVLPEGIQYIDRSAFEGSSVKQVVLPESLRYIDIRAFYNSEITSIVIPEGVLGIEGAAFADCYQLKEVTFSGKNAPIIGQGAFNNTPWLENNPNDFVMVSDVLIRYNNKTAKSAAIPQGVRMINSEAFANRSNLQSITIPESVRKIGSQAFMNTGLISVTIPETVEEIDGGAFWLCKGLKEVKWPQNINVIQRGMFADCISLKNITIPEGVTVIGDEAFRGCVVLEQVNLPQSIKRLGHEMLKNCESMRSLTVPGGVEWISPTMIEVNTPDNWLQTHLFRLIGTKGSYTEDFAKRNGYEFVPIGTTPPIDSAARLIYSGRLYQGAVMMDTRKYTMAPGYIYDIGVTLFGNASTKTRRVIPSSSSVASVKQLPNGNYRVTALRPGVTYITLYVIDPKDPLKQITHASIEFTIQNGVKPNGSSWRQMTYFN